MRRLVFTGFVAAGILIALSVGALATADSDGNLTRLHGYYEVPAISSTGEGTLRLRLDADADQLEWQLAWNDLEGTPTQAHIHFAQPDVAAGGILLYFCTNLGNAPGPPAPATLACPATKSGELSGTFTPAHITGNTLAQGIERGEWDEFVAALETGMTYAHIHSTRFTTGEIRGNIGKDRRGDNSDRRRDRDENGDRGADESRDD